MALVVSILPWYVDYTVVISSGLSLVVNGLQFCGLGLGLAYITGSVVSVSERGVAVIGVALHY